MKIVITFLLIVVLFSSCHRAPEKLETPWKPYSKAALADAVAHKKPVVIDFWAEWCPNCHDLDREVLSRPDVKARLARVTALRMDVTNQDDPAIQQIAQDYNIEGVPTVIFLDSHGKEINNSRVIGFVTADEFLQSLAMTDLLR